MDRVERKFSLLSVVYSIFVPNFEGILACNIGIPSTIDSRVAQGYDVVSTNIFSAYMCGSKVISVEGCLEYINGGNAALQIVVFLACSKRRRWCLDRISSSFCPSFLS